MAKQTLAEKEASIVIIGETNYIPFPKEWKTILENNNIGEGFNDTKHRLKLRLVGNRKAQIYIEAWLVLKTSGE